MKWINIAINALSASQSWSSYWTSLISAVIEDANPDKVVLTFPTAKSLVASDFTIAGFTISSATWGGTVLTLVLSAEVYEDDVVVVTFNKTGQTGNVTNNVAADQIGTILDDTFSSLADGWKTDKIGAGGSLAVSSGDLAYVRSGAGDFASKVYYDTLGMTMLENWEIEIVEKIAAMGDTTYGLYVGICNPTTFASARNIIAGVTLNNSGGSGALSIWDHTTNNYSSSGTINMTISNNDRIRIRFNRTKNVFTLYAKNLTTNSQEYSFAHTFPVNVTNAELLATAGYPCIQNLGGTVKVEYFKWTSTDYKKVNYAIIGDSMTTGYTASVIANSFAHKLQADSSKKTIILAAQASRTNEVVLATAEVLRIAPRKILILLGINDFKLDTKTLAQIETAYQLMVTTFINAGITPVFLNVLPQALESEVADFNTWINTTYGSTYDIVDLYTELVGVAPAINATYSGDGLHPNDAGHDLIYDTIVVQLPELL